MKGLIYKDITVGLNDLRRYWLLLLILFITMPLAFAWIQDDTSRIYECPILFTVSIPLGILSSAFGYDEKCGWMKHAMTSPIHRIQYYHAKILTTLVAMAGSGILGFLLSVTFSAVTGILTWEVFIEILGLSLVIAPIFGFGWSFCIPFILKFGMTKGLCVFLFSLIAFMIVFIIALLTFDDISLLLLLILGILFLVGLYLLGRKWIKEKEL